MYKEKTDMTNQEMFTALMERIDSMDAGLNSRMDRLEIRMDCLETRVEKMESDIEMEFKAVRIEMDRVYKVLKKDIFILNDKVDRLMIIKDVDGYEKMKIQVEVLTQGYQKLSERIG